jgi:hypothetical protein
MRIENCYKLREIAGETIIVNQGGDVDMTRIISLNESAALLYRELSGCEFSLDDAARVLVEAYEIDIERATTDAAVWVEALKDCKVISD